MKRIILVTGILATLLFASNCTEKTHKPVEDTLTDTSDSVPLAKDTTEVSAPDAATSTGG